MRQDMLLRSIVLYGILFASSCFAQSNHQDTPFVSAHAGAFVSSLDGFSNIYGSRLGFAPGLGVGVPVWAHFVLVGDATYFSKEGQYIWAVPTFVRPGALDFNQWNFNCGAFYDIDVSDLYSLDVSVGGTFITASEVSHYISTASVLSPEAGADKYSHRALGYFAAFAVERAFPFSPLTIFAQARYSFVDMPIFGMKGNVGGTEIMAGLRYYFKM